jgi:acetyl-CoA carboxylase carboxyltransferase component
VSGRARSEKMSKLRTFVDNKSEEFKRNAEAYEELLEELRDRMEEARRGGGEKARKRHEERGKLPVRDRVDFLLDPNTAFLELSPLAAFGCTTGRCRRRG